MSGSLPRNLLSPLGQGVPLPGNNAPTPPGPRAGSSPLSGSAPPTMGVNPVSLRGPTMPQMQAMVAQPPPMAGPPTAGGMPTSESLQDQLTSQMKRAKASFDAAGKALKQVDAVRKGLSNLADKQDMVTLEDVIHEFGKLAAHGLDPVGLAGIIADAPSQGGGEALGGWVAGRAQIAMQGEQQLISLRNSSAHEMGVAALHSMMAAVAGHKLPNPQDPGTDPGNDLSPRTQYGARFMNQKAE